MNKEQRPFFEHVNESNLLQFFAEISIDVLKSSKRVYCWILAISASFTIGSIASTYFNFHIAAKVLESVMGGTNGIFLLIPPFTLAVIAMFPAFSAETKTALSQKMSHESDQPLGTVFLSEFTFIIFWSLTMLGHNFFATLLIDFKKRLANSSMEVEYLICVACGVWFLLFFTLLYEIAHSLKLLYLLILREYYK